MMIRRTFALVVVAVAAGLLPSPRACALPDAVLQKSDLSADDRKQVTAFAEGLIPGLSSDDPALNRAARDEALNVLAKGVSVAVRLELSNALQQPLLRLVASPNDRVSFNACRVAGALATSGSIDVVRAALADPRPPVRYGGAFGARRTLEEQSSKRSPLDAAATRGLIRGLDDALRKENDPGVVDGLVVAFEATGGEVRAEALSLMCKALADQGVAFNRKDRGGDPETWARAFRRGVRAAQSALLAQLRTGKPDIDFARAAAEMGGVMLAHVSRRIDSMRSGVRSESETDILRELLADAEGTLIFINENLAPGSAKPVQRLRAAFDAEMAGGEGAQGQVAAEASSWIGPSGLLTKPPYGVDVKRFTTN